MTLSIPDFTTFSSQTYSLAALCFFNLLIALSCVCYTKKDPRLEKNLFWLTSCFLVAFTILRPINIARDDTAYIEIAAKVCPLFECFQPIQSSRDWGWYFLVSTLKSFMAGEHAMLLLAGIGTLIQLVIIYKLCRHKLLALTLFTPLIYLYYDFTFLRACLALTAFFAGLYFLASSRNILGSSLLLGNYLFHSQGIFSIAIIPFKKIAKYKYISAIFLTLLIICIYGGWTPSFSQLAFLDKYEASTYWTQYQEGLFAKERPFPIAQLGIITYFILIFLLGKPNLEENLIERYAFASILLAVFLSWIFAPIHAMQTRLFDFYTAPLVFLVGNLRLTKTTLAATLGLAVLLYIRMELLHNWIIG